MQRMRTFARTIVQAGLGIGIGVTVLSAQRWQDPTKHTIQFVTVDFSSLSIEGK